MREQLAQALPAFERLLAANQDPLVTPYLQERLGVIRMQVPQPGEEWRSLLTNAHPPWAVTLKVLKVRALHSPP